MLTKFFPDNFTLETPRMVLTPVSLDNNNHVVFNIVDNYSKNICGTSEYIISFENKTAEMTWQWNDPEDADQGLIKNLKFAMLSYGFQVMKMEQITMKGDGSMTITREEWPRTKEIFFPELM